MKWAIKGKSHFEILIAVMWVSNLFQSIGYNNQTTNNDAKNGEKCIRIKFAWQQQLTLFFIAQNNCYVIHEASEN